MTESYADLGGLPSTAALPDVRRGCGQRTCRHPDRHAVPCNCSHRVEKGGKK